MMSKGGFNMSNKDPYTKETDTRFTLRISTELLEKVKLQAKKTKRSTGKEIEFIIEDWFKKNNYEE